MNRTIPSGFSFTKIKSRRFYPDKFSVRRPDNLYSIVPNAFTPKDNLVLASKQFRANKFDELKSQKEACIYIQLIQRRSSNVKMFLSSFFERGAKQSDRETRGRGEGALIRVALVVN